QKTKPIRDISEKEQTQICNQTRHDHGILKMRPALSICDSLERFFTHMLAKRAQLCHFIGENRTALLTDLRGDRRNRPSSRRLCDI
ncbi:MAG: hypothetical protein AAFW47_08810, partial [Pseudomonadota bacterium]